MTYNDGDLIGWRIVRGKLYAPHYYQFKKRNVISLCGKYSSLLEDLEFPQPGSELCAECQEKAIKRVWI